MNAFGREIRPLIPQDAFSDMSRSQFDWKDWLEEETILITSDRAINYLTAGKKIAGDVILHTGST